MRRAVWITGLCRSGTAAVAEICHVLGYPMGRSFLAPPPPDHRFDWEDVDLTTWLARTVEAEPGPGLDFTEYMDARLDHSAGFGFRGRLGFKSPLLILAGGPLDEELARRGIRPLRIAVHRAPEAVERSICRQPLCAAVLRRWNERIHTALAQPHDAQVSYEALVAEPAGEVRRLAEALGIVDPVAISRAAARVAKPLS